MNCLTDDQVASLAIEATEDGREHLAGCPACRERLAGLLSRMARVEAALTAHEAGRVRLLAALSREPSPAPLIWRLVMNRRTWAVAAAAGIAVVLWGWPGVPPAAALAEALRPFKEARSFRCEMTALIGGKPVAAPGGFTTRLTWAAPGSLATEQLVKGEPRTRAALPHGKAGVAIDHAAKTYTPLGRGPGMQEQAVLRIIHSLAADTPADAKPAGTDDVGGVKAPRFELSAANPAGGRWRYHVWIDPKTRRALRVQLALRAGADPADKDTPAVRLEKFEWDVKTDAALDTKPPAGYKVVVVKPDEAQEKTTKLIVAALKAYREAAGAYPKGEPFDAPTAVGELVKLTKKKVAAETVQGLVTIGVLQAVSKEAVYRGKTVGPDDKGKVLFRWKLDDGRYGVIFGDLKAETVSAERLKELEGK